MNYTSVCCEGRFLFICRWFAVKMIATILLYMFPFLIQALADACSGNDWYQYQNDCYLFVDVKETWATAKDICNQNNSHLVRIDNADTNTFLKTKMRNKGITYIWTGANDINMEGDFVWDDNGAQVNYSDWETNNPNDYRNQDCVRLATVDAWNDVGCSWSYMYACQKTSQTNSTSNADGQVSVTASSVQQITTADDAEQTTTSGNVATGSGDGEQTTSSDDGEQTTSSGDGEQTTSSGDGEQTTSSDDGEQTTSSGYGEQTTSSDDGEQTTSSGDGEQTTSSDDGEQTTSSDDGEQTTSSDDGEQTTSSVDGEQTTSSDNAEQTTSLHNAKQTTSNTESSTFRCFCCNRNNVSLTGEKKQQIITELKKELSVVKANTSASRRKLISVTDSRPSSVAMGSLGCALLALVLGFIVVPDLVELCLYLSSLARTNTTQEISTSDKTTTGSDDAEQATCSENVEQATCELTTISNDAEQTSARKNMIQEKYQLQTEQ